jgi:predicted transcriptional regulator
MDDKRLHGTNVRGEDHYLSKLTKDDVLHIKSISPSMSQRQIAKQYGVSQMCIWNILAGRSWGWAAPDLSTVHRLRK